MHNVLIGLPIYRRAWILEHWLKCIENQSYPLENLGFIFELGPNDDETHNMLWQFHLDHPELIVFDGQIEMSRRHQEHQEGERAWNSTRYENMAIFRNSLLERAIAHQDKFDFYFSLDSDLLLEDPDTISKLVNTMVENNLDVLAPLCYMTPVSTSYPNCMYWIPTQPSHGERRLDLFKINALQEADIVMAAVIMSKKVFTTAKYRPHIQGEDLGFAKDLSKLGFKSYLDTRVYVPHIMHKNMLEGYLKTGQDPRKPVDLPDGNLLSSRENVNSLGVHLHV